MAGSLFTANQLFAQAQNVVLGTDQTVMPPPTAASLGKFTDIPVDYASGLPQINIPIHTVQEGPISHPIGLSYHAEGMRVAQPVGWAGLGWNITGVGMVSRTVQGLVDETTNGFYNGGGRGANFGPFAIYEWHAYHNGIRNGTTDGEPDLFSFNTGTVSGKFFFDEQKTLQVIDLSSDVAIGFETAGGGTSFESFVVTTKTGIKYHFGKVGLSGSGVYEEMYSSATNTPYRTSWLLVRIESLDGHFTINFEYEKEDYAYYMPANGSITKDGSGGSFSPAFPGANGFWGSGTNKFHYINNTVYGQRLRKIISRNETVDFLVKAGVVRQDLRPVANSSRPPRELDRIKVSQGSSVCTDHVLSFDYTTNDGSTPEVPGQIGAAFTKRLRLNGVQAVSCSGDGESTPPYQFAYKGPGGGAQLPHRFTRAVDHWGFYNGAHTNNYNALNIPPSVIVHPLGLSDITYGNANRESNEDYMLRGSLQRITYPTGGTQTFTFEGNRVQDFVINRDVAIPTIYACNDYSNNCCGANVNSATYTFASDSEIDMARFDVFGTLIVGNAGNGQNPGEDAPCDGATQITVAVVVTDPADNEMGRYEMRFDRSESSQLDRNILLSCEVPDLQAGVAYTFTMTATHGRGAFTLFNTMTVPADEIVGGLRIRKIEADGNMPDYAPKVSREYRYYRPGDEMYNSGELAQRANYTVSGFYEDDARRPQLFAKFSETSQYPLTAYDGRHILYRFVTELLPNGSRTERSFHFSPIDNNDIFLLGSVNNQEASIYPGWSDAAQAEWYRNEYLEQVPSNQPYSFDDLVNTINLLGSPFQINYQPFHSTFNRLHGLPIEQRMYDAGDNIVARTIFEHGGYKRNITSNNPNQPNFSFGVRVIGLPVPGDNMYHSFRYRMKVGARLQTKVTSIIDGMVTEQKTYYDDSYRHHSPVAMTTTNSDGKVDSTALKYAHDYDFNDAGGFIRDKMIATNQVGIPWKTETFYGGVPTGGSITEFAQFSRTSGNLFVGSSPNADAKAHKRHLIEVASAPGGLAAPTLFESEVIDGYHPAGNPGAGMPRSIVKTGWAPEIYTWSGGKILSRTYEDFTWTYNYYPGSRLLQQSTDIDGQTVSYIYDGLQRLKTTTARGGAVTTNYDYSYYNQNSQGRNYVRNRTTFTPQAGSELTQLTTFSYLDGLGRPLQTVRRGYSDDEKDVVVGATTYDLLGRPVRQYETFGINTTNGNFFSNLAGKFYTLTEYEADPLSRPRAVTPPDWDYPTLTSYGTNTTSITSPGGTIFPANTLAVTTVTDGNGNTNQTFADKLGRSVLMRRYEGAPTGTPLAQTFTAYDDKDRPSTIYPPGTSNSTPELLYKYTYDGRDRVVEKKIPDQGPMRYWYNERDLLTFSQDANQAETGEALHTKYDIYGRVLSTGLVDVDDAPTNGSAELDYAYPLTTTCYDGCEFDGTAPAIYTGKPMHVSSRVLGTDNWLSQTTFYDPHGRPARTEANNPLNFSDQQAEVMNYTYDFADNPLTTNRIHLGGVGVEPFAVVDQSTFDHSGRVAQVQQSLAGNAFRVFAQHYSAKDEVVRKMLGQGAGSGWLQEVDYDYRPNGFLAGINATGLGDGSLLGVDDCDPVAPTGGGAANSTAANDLFSLQLFYDATPGLGTTTTPQQNGNIAGYRYRTRGRTMQAYAFTYDGLDRLKTADHAQQRAGGGYDQDAYNTSYAYDNRGNLRNLTRKGKSVGNDGCLAAGEIDKLTYSYQSSTNKIRRITDAASNPTDKTFVKTAGYHRPDTLPNLDYQYDANGNLIYDPSRGLTTFYNYLNLPERFDFEDCRQIEITYTADGTKIGETTYNGSQAVEKRVYAGGIEYVNGRRESVAHAAGRTYYDRAGPRQEYNLTDHLGNVRVVFSDRNGNGTIELNADPDQSEVLSEKHYYPFGLEMEGNWLADLGRETRYLYTGKELNRELGMYDYGARWYDPSIARWGQVDPLAETMPSWSTYNYTFNDPIKHTDPDGRNPIIGAGIGLLVGVGVSLWNQRNNEHYDFGQVLIDGGKGALTGGLIGAFGPAAIAKAGASVTATTTEGILINATISGGATATSDMVGQMVEVAAGKRAAEDVSLAETAQNAVIGAAAGGVGGYVGGKIQAATSVTSPKAVSEIRRASSGVGARESQREAVKRLGPNPTKAQVKQARSTARAQVRKDAYDKVTRRAKVYAPVGAAVGASSTNASKQALIKLKNWAIGN